MGLPGPLLIVLGQIHGNEPAGTQAVSRLFEMIDQETHNKPGFRFFGKVLGLRGNLKAITEGQRYVDQDMNRLWKPENLHKWLTEGVTVPPYEAQECLELYQLVKHEIADYQPTRCFILDIHTTTATGGIFLVPTPHPHSLDISYELHAPIVTGLIEILKGTLATFAQEKQPWGIPTDTLVFEAGQHHAPSSISHAISAIVGTMRALDMLEPSDVEHTHDRLLKEAAQGIPKLTQVVYRHSIQATDRFHMLPGFKNFMPIKLGQELAYDRKGPIYAPMDGYVLMPLYQRQGEDGFFILQKQVYDPN